MSKCPRRSAPPVNRQDQFKLDSQPFYTCTNSSTTIYKSYSLYNSVQQSNVSYACKRMIRIADSASVRTSSSSARRGTYNEA